jgi:NAD(P)-dependent dehydrogenase (short-subunit alcohol dehydrogenase family)
MSGFDGQTGPEDRNADRNRDRTEGESVVIVGGSHGIGAAAARAFARSGAGVMITGRSKDRLDELVENIAWTRHQPRAHQLDATDEAAVADFFAGTGPIDHLVLAASPGAVGSGPFASLDSGALRQAFDGKFFAHFNALRAAQVRKSVTVITAASARAAYAGAAGLAAVNGALEAMIRPLAIELAPVRINAVSPGIIDTPWWDALPADQRAALFASAAAITPVRRVGRPEEVAEAVLYLAGADFVTGTVLECTGGAHLTAGAAG